MGRFSGGRSWGSVPAECERIDARFDGYLDDDLAAAERDEVELHLATCAPCRQELALAESVLSELRSLPVVTPDKPPSVPAHAAGAAALEASTGSPARSGQARESGSEPRHLWSHPLLQAAAVLVLLSGLWLALSDSPLSRPFGSDGPRSAEGDPRTGDRYTEAEIRAAEEDLRLALSYFGGLAEKAGLVVRDEVIGERVVAPTRRAFRRIGDFGLDDAASDQTSFKEVEKNP